MQLVLKVIYYHRNEGPTRNLERSCRFSACLNVLGLLIVTSLSGSESHAFTAASESTFKKSNTCGVSNNRLYFTLLYFTMRFVKKCFWMVFLASGRVSLKEWPRKFWVVESLRKFSDVIKMWWWIILWQVNKSTMRRRCSKDFSVKIFSRLL